MCGTGATIEPEVGRGTAIAQLRVEMPKRVKRLDFIVKVR